MPRCQENKALTKTLHHWRYFYSMRMMLVIFLSFVSLQSIGQLSDMISVKKKNGRIIKTFTAGMPIVFETNTGYTASGVINVIKNDTLYLTIHNVQFFPTTLGVTSFDTVATYIDPFAFNDIARIRIFKKRGFISGLGKVIMIGSAGYFALNLVNGNYLKMPFSDDKNLRTLAIAGGSFGAGFLLNKYFKADDFTRSKKHQVTYIKLR